METFKISISKCEPSLSLNGGNTSFTPAFPLMDFGTTDAPMASPPEHGLQQSNAEIALKLFAPHTMFMWG